MTTSKPDFGFLSHVLDPYVRSARLGPVLLIILPIALLVVAWFPDLRSTLGILVSIACSFGLVFWFAELARDEGKRGEPELFQKWGGKPSVALLRQSDTRIDSYTKQRYRDFLSAKNPKLKFPSPQQEAADPAAADEVYQSATAYLLTQTRDTKQFGLLFQENISYGFRRNVWGLKRYGRAASLIAAFGSTGLAGAKYLLEQQRPEIMVILATAFAWIIAIWWFARVNSSWVRIPADEYGKHLLAACDTLGGGAAKQSPGTTPKPRASRTQAQP
jgi:hypothetical protein